MTRHYLNEHNWRVPPMPDRVLLDKPCPECGTDLVVDDYAESTQPDGEDWHLRCPNPRCRCTFLVEFDGAPDAPAPVRLIEVPDYESGCPFCGGGSCEGCCDTCTSPRCPRNQVPGCLHTPHPPTP